MNSNNSLKYFNSLNECFKINIHQNIPLQLDITYDPPAYDKSELPVTEQRKYAFYYISSIKGNSVQQRREMTIYQKNINKIPKSFAFTNGEMYVFNREVNYDEFGKVKSIDKLYLAFAGEKYVNNNFDEFIPSNGPNKDIVESLKHGSLLITQIQEIAEDSIIELPIALIPSNTLFYIDDDEMTIHCFKIENKFEYLKNHRKIKGKPLNDNWYLQKGRYLTIDKNKQIVLIMN